MTKDEIYLTLNLLNACVSILEKTDLNKLESEEETHKHMVERFKQLQHNLNKGFTNLN